MVIIDISSLGSEWTVKCLLSMYDCHQMVCSSSGSFLGGMQGSTFLLGRTFSSGAVWGPCYFFVHARVLFKFSNLRKGTPAIDHRIWICGVGGQGETAFGVQPGNVFNENRMAFNGQPLGGPINLRMTFSDTCVSGDWLQPTKHQPIIPLLNCDLSGRQQQLITWCHEWIPSRLRWVSQGPLWLLWHLHPASFYGI